MTKMLAAATALAIGGLGAGPACADALFGCEARAGQTCYFKIYYSPRGTRIVQLPSGMRVNITDLQAGRDHYCESVQQPPAYDCARKPVGNGYND